MRGGWRTFVVVGVFFVVAAGFGVVAYRIVRQKSAESQATRRPSVQTKFRHQTYGKYTLWWDQIPELLRQAASASGPGSNIRAADYAGPDACKNCHKPQYEGWSNHPHRWMNARIENAQVRGDFNDRRISYLGGEVTFTRSGEQYRMRLERGDVKQEYVVEQTIGSRFFQYYVGRQLEGPESADHPVYSEAHVLPLGYWVDRQEWVPTVHIGDEVRDEARPDPFVPRPPYSHNFADYADHTVDLYRSQCNFCHTTFAIGDLFLRFQPNIGRHVPTKLDVSLGEYVQKARPEFWPEGKTPADMTDAEFEKILLAFFGLEASQHAVTLGISCEACHLGAKEHAEGKLVRPRFFPNGPEVVVRSQSPNSEYDRGRTHDNINWACGRCHAGNRPQFANGIATWNSTEYTDATRGSCYSQLTCVRCHNPHESIGHDWKLTPAQDDAICLSCHQKYEPDQARVAHTHHPLDHEGSRCMNCHMPRINEGLQEVVRTHTIFSPTNPAMIEANQMNACNQCHVDKSIDWTLTYLRDWYRKTFRETRINASYPDRKQSAAIGWLKSGNEAVRLVAADSLARAEARWALPDLLQALDDPFILNRQFARIGLERMLNVKLSDFGYQFYQTRTERVGPLSKLREQLLRVNAGVEGAETPADSGFKTEKQ